MSDHWYRGHGLVFRSELELPEFTPAPPGTADVEIRLSPEAHDAAVMARGGGPMKGGFQPSPAGMVKVIKEIGAILVRDGAEIVVSPVAAHDPALLKLFVLGSGMGMLLHQKDRLVLHGAAVSTQGGARVILGQSGAGKSTLAAHLGRMGYGVLSDDLSGVVEGPPGRFSLWPGARALKLWGDALASMDMDVSALDHVHEGHPKYWAAPATLPEDTASPIVELIVLASDASGPSLTNLAGLGAMQALADNVYRPHQVRALGNTGPQFARLGRMVGQVPVRRLSRPWDAARIAETTALLGDHWGPPC